MDNQNLNNGMNENNIQTTDVNLNNVEQTNQNMNSINQVSNVETLDILDDTQSSVQPQTTESSVAENTSTVISNQDAVVIPTNDFNSFIKQPDPVVQNPNELLNAVPKPDMMISSPDANSISSDELLEDYVGKNYEKISKRKFNLSALFLGSLYLFYRKMTLLGILVSILSIVLYIIGLLINPILIFILSLVLSLILCFMFNKLYIDNAKKSIDKIKKKYTNKSISEIKEICKKNGGTSIAFAIVFSLIMGAITSGIMTLAMPIIAPNLLTNLRGMFNTNLEENNNPIEEEFIEGQDSNKYNGVLNYNTGVVINDNVTMGFLQVFTPSTFNSDYTLDYDYLTTPNDTSSKCNFKLSVINDYTDSKTLIDEMAEYNNVTDTNSTTSNKNITWDTFTVTGDLKTTHYNATVNNNLVYLLEYNIDSNANVNICDAFYNGIVNSIDFK